jgi:pyridoxal 4-dehydrogenase
MLPNAAPEGDNSMKLQDRVAIVTGAGQGIGRAIAEKLSQEGATVVVADVNAETAQKTAADVGGFAYPVDVSIQEQVAGLATAVLDRYGKIDVLVNDAAIVPFVPWEDLDFAEWRRIMSVNLDGVFLTCRAVYPHMKAAGYGRIVNIASNVVLAGTPNMAHYVAAKGGVFAFTRALATELGRWGITVNAVAPGLTASEGVMAGPHAEAFDFVVPLQAIPRRAVPADIAPAVAFLASEEASWVTGAMIVADGGHTRH